MLRISALSLLISCSVLCKKATAQYYFYDNNYYDNPLVLEVGGSLNAMNCLTDLGGKRGIGARFFKDFNSGTTKPGGGLYASITYKNVLALRFEATVGSVAGEDKVLAGVTDIAKQRFNRNQNFRSSITEVAGMLEIHPLFLLIDWQVRDEVPPRLSPYVVGGIGFFSFNPQGKVPNSNQWVDLQPLSTEGQGFPEHPNRPVYKLKQMNFPLGAGVRYEISSLFNLRAEAVYRVLKTDYLDDVSTRYIDPALFAKNLDPALANLARIMADKQIVKITPPNGGGKRGSPSEKDAYFSFNLKLGFIIGRERAR